MKNIKQAVYATAAGALAFTPLMAGAAITASTNNNGVSVSNTGTAASTLANTSVFNLVSNAMNWLLGLVGVLAVIAFVISGILYLTAAGDEERVETAKKTMMFAIIGLVVAFIGLIVVNAVAGLTGAGSVGSTY